MAPMRSLFALSLVLALAACDSKPPAEGGKTKAQSPAKAAPTAKADSPAKTLDPKNSPGALTGYAAAITKAFDDAGLKLGPGPLAGWDLPAPNPTFLGWSKDGKAYAVATAIGHEEIPGGAPFWVRFVEVRDAHTQQVLAAFQGEPFKDENWGDDVRPEDDLEKKANAIWKKLPKEKEGVAHLKELGITSSTPMPKKLKLGTKANGNAPHGSRFRVKADKTGFGFVWDNLQSPGDDDDTTKKSFAPKIEVSLTMDGAEHALVTVRPNTSYQELQGAADMDIPYLDGGLASYWDPSGHRVALAFSEEMHNQHEEYGSVSRSVFYIRALGPQVKIIDAGVGEEVARKAAAVFDKAGLHVTVVEKGKKPTDGASLYFRGAFGKKAAGDALELIPGARSEELKKDGWIDLIVVLGKRTAQ